MLCAHTRISGLDGKKWGRRRGRRRSGKRHPESLSKKDPLCADEIVPGVEVVEITVGGGHSMLALRSFQSVMKQRKNWGYICGLLVRKFCTTEG